MIMARKKLPPDHSVTIAQLCESYGMKRDAHYKYQRRDKIAIATKTTVIAMVKERRKDLPREGGKKLHKAFQNEFLEKGIKVGRDKLFAFLRDQDMLVKRKKSYVNTRT